MDFLNMQVDPTGGPVKRLRGDSIQEIEEAINYLETSYQGELWDAAN